MQWFRLHKLVKYSLPSRNLWSQKETYSKASLLVNTPSFLWLFRYRIPLGPSSMLGTWQTRFGVPLELLVHWFQVSGSEIGINTSPKI